MQLEDIALKLNFKIGWEKRRIIFKSDITFQTRRELEKQGHIRGDNPEQDIQISNTRKRNGRIKGKLKRLVCIYEDSIPSLVSAHAGQNTARQQCHMCLIQRTTENNRLESEFGRIIMARYINLFLYDCSTSSRAPRNLHHTQHEA